MRMTLENTSKIVELNGVPARIWEGCTESGIPVVAFVTRVAVAEGQAAEAYAEFERELRATRPPSAEAAAIPARLIL